MKKLLQSIWGMLSRPKVVVPIALALALAIGIPVYILIESGPTYEYAEAQVGNVSSDLNLSGTIKTADDVNLAFLASGRIASVSAKVGQHIKAGTVLARLDIGSLAGAVKQAWGSYQISLANYDKLIHGISDPELAVAQKTVDVAKQAYEGVRNQQDTLVENAYRAMIGSGLSAVLDADSIDVPPSNVPIVSGIYTGGQEGEYHIAVTMVSGKKYFEISGIEHDSGKIEPGMPQAMGHLGLYVQFTDIVPEGSEWIVEVPNTRSSLYMASYNAYEAAKATREQLVNNARAQYEQAEIQLEAKQASARSEDVRIAQAQVDIALGAYQAATSNYANAVVTSPIAGTITFVDLRVGEIVAAGKTVIGVVTDNKFQIETNVSSDDLSKLSLGAKATVTLDSDGTKFNAEVAGIDAGAFITSSSKAMYKVTFALTDKDPQIQAGLTAHISIAGETKNDVLTIPRAALISQNGGHAVMVKSTKKSIPEIRFIQTGLIGSDSVEIINGLTSGEKLVVLN
jgi:RND family efflux transporter MFP subunit